MTDPVHELHHRTNDGLDVRLLWRASDSQVFVTVADAKTGERFTVDVRDGDNALEVFHHPYAFAAWRGIDTRSESIEELSWAA
jgi:hypothetical protein